MAARQPPKIELVTVVEETGLPPDVVASAMLELCDAKLVEELLTHTTEGPKPICVFRITTRGKRAASRLAAVMPAASAMTPARIAPTAKPRSRPSR